MPTLLCESKVENTPLALKDQQEASENKVLAVMGTVTSFTRSGERREMSSSHTGRYFDLIAMFS